MAWIAWVSVWPALAQADTEFALYGALEAAATTEGSADTTATSFRTASLDAFATSQLERWSFLAELVFEAHSEGSDLELDPERLEVGYLHREWLRVRLGRSHSAIGFYNDAYHHGAYFMIPASRPRAVGFEDDGGLIPSHSVGVHLDGRLALGHGGVRYDLELSNGRGATPTEVLDTHDANHGKAMNVRLRYEAGGALDGLLLGANVALGEIPANDVVASPPTHAELQEQLYGVHLAYQAHALYLVAEGYLIRRVERGDGRAHRTLAGFLEVARSFDAASPYLRYEAISWPGEPELYSGASGSLHVLSAGLRYLANDAICLKAELALELPQESADRRLAAVAQLAFAF